MLVPISLASPAESTPDSVITPRTSSGQLDTVQNKLQNLGGIDASGYDIAFSYLSPETSFGTFTLDVDATHLAEYKEITNNPDGTQSVNDLTGQAPDETFFRAFPEWRAVTSLGWNMNRFSDSLRFRIWASSRSMCRCRSSITEAICVRSVCWRCRSSIECWMDCSRRAISAPIL